MWNVEVRDCDTDKPVKVLGPYAQERLAEKADDGVNRNLNHEAFYTVIVLATPAQPREEPRDE